MQAQAKQNLATRLGQTVTWMDENSTVAGQQLSQNRDKDVSSMIAQSSVYNWEPGEDDPFWQKIQSLYLQQGLFQKLEIQLDSSAVAGSPTIATIFRESLPISRIISFENALGRSAVKSDEWYLSLGPDFLRFESQTTQTPRSDIQFADSGIRKQKPNSLSQMTQGNDLKIKDFDLI